MIHGGYVWPEGDAAHEVILREAQTAIPKVLELVRGRDCIIQAGANVGVYPNILAEHFGKVVTAEPDPENFRCLMVNVRPEVDARKAAFGAIGGRCATRVVSPGNCGAHRVVQGDESPVLTIDSLGLKPDVIWLDVEGYEYFALLGAEQTLKAHHPVVIIEEKGLEENYDLRPENCREFLRTMGYSRVDRIGNDNVYKVTQ